MQDQAKTVTMTITMATVMALTMTKTMTIYFTQQKLKSRHVGHRMAPAADGLAT